MDFEHDLEDSFGSGEGDGFWKSVNVLCLFCCWRVIGVSCYEYYELDSYLIVYLDFSLIVIFKIVSWPSDFKGFKRSEILV